jgi:hypothetical protein
VLSFHHAIVESFTCPDLRPTFFQVDQWLVSIPIEPGGEDLVLPCPLERGTYPYRINLSSRGSVAGMGNPELSLEATLVFE